MSANKDIIVAFDLYGTLLSTESIAKELAQHFGPEKAQTIATVWRRYQLEYTWRLNSMSTYTIPAVQPKKAHKTLQTNTSPSPP